MSDLDGGYKKNKFIAALLALFGGVFGLHRFYLGDVKTGIMFFMVFILTVGMRLPISLFLAIMDFFKIMSMGQSEFDRRYNKRFIARQKSQKRPRQAVRQTKQITTNTKKNAGYFERRANPYKKTAYIKYKEFDIVGAAKDFEKALDIDAKDKDIYFHLACCYSLLEKPDKSLYYLDMALKHGYNNLDKISSIDELAFLRIQPAFEQFKQNNYSTKEVLKLASPKENLLDNDLLLSQLNKLNELRNRGLLSEKEYELERRKLINR